MFFQTDTIAGFYAALFEQFVVTYIYTFWFFVFILFYIGLCSYIGAFVCDLSDLIAEFNSTLVPWATLEKSKKDYNLIQRDAQTVAVFKGFIELHIDMIKWIFLGFSIRIFSLEYFFQIWSLFEYFFTKYFISPGRLLDQIGFIMTGPLFFELSSCIIGTVFELLALDQTIQDQQLDATVVVSANALSIHVSMVYILCHYAEKLTAQSIEVSRMVYYDLLWYKLSVRQQKNIIMPLRRAQKLFKLDGYGIFACSMELFLNVRSMKFESNGNLWKSYANYLSFDV